jgi:amino acid transporter
LIELKITLVLAIASLLAMVSALIMGELWPAAVCGIGAVFGFGSYHWNKRGLEQQP